MSERLRTEGQVQLAVFGCGLNDIAYKHPGVAEADSPQSHETYRRAVVAAETARGNPDSVARVVFLGRYSILKSRRNFPRGTSEALAAFHVARSVWPGIDDVAHVSPTDRTAYGGVFKAVRAGVLDPQMSTLVVVHKHQEENVRDALSRGMPDAPFGVILADENPGHPEHPEPSLNDRVTNKLFGVVLRGAGSGPEHIIGLSRRARLVEAALAAPVEALGAVGLDGALVSLVSH